MQHSVKMLIILMQRQGLWRLWNYDLYVLFIFQNGCMSTVE